MTEAAGRPVEVELKYRMTGAASGERFLAADELAGLHALGSVEEVRQEDRYVDTADGALTHAGYAARFRSGGVGTLITLKGLRRDDDGGAAHRREELEGPADPGLPASSWPPSPARDAVLRIAGDRPLAELARLRQVRRRRHFGTDGTDVELSVDDVEVIAGGEVVERFAELEAELRSGDEAVLDRLAVLFNDVEELVPADTSKLERALDAVRREPSPDGAGGPAPTEAGTLAAPAPTFDGAAGPAGEDVIRVVDAGRDAGEGDGTTHGAGAQPGGPGPSAGTPSRRRGAKAGPVEPPADGAPPEPRLTAGKTPGVTADDHLAEAGRKVLRFHLARMVAREAGTRDGADAEELHGMRVATRRQRAAWRVFGDAFDPKRTARHQERLKLVARDLGAVRDLDVLIEAGVAYQAGQAAPESEAFEPLVATWRARRDTARAVLLRELDSGRYRRWLDEYIDFVQAEGQGARPVTGVRPHRVRDTMPSRIWSAYEGVRAYEAVMRWADVTTLHDLRIAAKWLRYTLEFVREALGRDAGPLIEKVVALQDHLGWLHDADVAAGLARQFLVEHAGELDERESAAIGRYLVDRERELARLRRTVGPAWRGVSSLAYRRALGRVVAGL